MKHLTQKLKSQRGASMLFALLVFLLCMLAGTAALTAAAANAGRYTHLESEQRQYFSTSSALALLQSELDAAAALTVTATYTETQNWQYDATGSTTTPTYGPAVCTLTLTPEENLNYYQKLLLQNCVPTEWRDDYKGPSGSSFPTPDFPPLGLEYKYTIKPDPDSITSSAIPEAADTLYPVEVTLNGTEGSYTLQMELTTGDDDAYPLRVVWSGKAETETTSSTKITGDPTAPNSSGTRTTVTTLTCTLRWPAENRAVTFTK